MRNAEWRATGMIPITQTTSQILDTVLNVMDQWSTATDMTLLILSWYLHCSHPYLSDPQLRQIKSWPTFTTHTQTLQHWQLKLPDLSVKTTKIPWKYWHHSLSPPMKDLPKGWVYEEEGTDVKRKALHNLSQYHHLSHLLTCAQHQLEQWHHSNHLKGSSTTSGWTSSLLPSPTSTECQHQHGSSKST